MLELWTELVESDAVVLCSPVLLELLYSARDPREYEALRSGFEGFRRLSLDARAERAAERAQALLAERSERRGPTPTDLLIAGIAEVNGVTLLHYDRHFDTIARVTGQQTEWLAPRGSVR